MKPALWQAHSAEESLAELMQSALPSLAAHWLSRLELRCCSQRQKLPK